MLLGVVGDDPALGDALHRQAIRESRHLHRVLHRHLFLGRQRQRGPVAGVFQGARAVGVEGDLDLDHPVVVRLGSAAGGDALQHVRQQGFGVKLGGLAAGADQAVAAAAGIFGDHGAGGGNVDRHHLLGPVIDRGVLGLVELAFEAHPLLAPQPAHQGDGFAQAGEALLEVGPVHAGGRHFVQPLAGADAEDDALGEHGAQRAESLGDDGGMVAEGGGEHRGAHDDALGARAECPEPGEREDGVAVDVLPGLEMVADEDGIETALLGHDREIQQLAWRELFRRRLVPELQHSSVPKWPSHRCGLWWPSSSL